MKKSLFLSLLLMFGLVRSATDHQQKIMNFAKGSGVNIACALGLAYVLFKSYSIAPIIHKVWKEVSGNAVNASAEKMSLSICKNVAIGCQILPILCPNMPRLAKLVCFSGSSIAGAFAIAGAIAHHAKRDVKVFESRLDMPVNKKEQKEALKNALCCSCHCVMKMWELDTSEIKPTEFNKMACCNTYICNNCMLNWQKSDHNTCPGCRTSGLRIMPIVIEQMKVEPDRTCTYSSFCNVLMQKPTVLSLQ